MLFGKFFGHFYRETVRIVKTESRLTGNRVSLLIMNQFFKFFHAGRKRFFESLLLERYFFYYATFVCCYFGINVSVYVYNGKCDFFKRIALEAELTAETNSSSEQPSEYISLVNVRTRNALFVTDNKHRSSYVICDDSFCLLIGHGGKFSYLIDYRYKNVCIVYAFFALQDTKSTLQSHSRIDVFLFKRLKLSVCSLIVLHKYVVPNFQIFAAIARRVALVAAVRNVGYVEHFAVRSARTGNSCRSPPVILLGKIEYTTLIYTALFPEFCALIISRAVFVACENRNGKMLRIYTEILLIGKEFIAPSYLLLFKIVTERPVSEHLKERAVACVADFVYISRTNTLLNVRQPIACRVLSSQKVGNERMHSRSRK